MIVRLATASVALAACSTSTPTISLTTTSPTPPTTDMYGSAPGTSAAWATADRLTAVPVGSRDCGQEDPTSGFPTTAAPRPDHWDCIVAAAKAGEPAWYAVLSRDHRGGVDVTIYQVFEPGVVRIVHVDVDWTGSPGPLTKDSCTGLRAPVNFTSTPICVTT